MAGSKRAEFSDVQVPVGDETLQVRMLDVELTTLVTDDGLASGELSGRLDIEAAATSAEPLIPGQTRAEILEIFEGQADLEPDEDGFCTQVSAATAFHAVPAILVP